MTNKSNKQPKHETARRLSRWSYLTRRTPGCRSGNCSQRLASASPSNPRLARSYTKISTNTPRPPLMENRVFLPFSAPHSPLNRPLRPQCERCTAWRCRMCRFHGLGMVILPPPLQPPTFGSWLFSPAAASTTYFLPLPLLPARRRSAHASSCAE